MENKMENIIEVKKRGRPITIVGETPKDRNNATMKALRDSGYFKEYYKKSLKKQFCCNCNKVIETVNIKQHQKTKICINTKAYNDVLELLLTKMTSL